MRKKCLLKVGACLIKVWVMLFWGNEILDFKIGFCLIEVAFKTGRFLLNRGCL